MHGSFFFFASSLVLSISPPASIPSRHPPPAPPPPPNHRCHLCVPSICTKRHITRESGLTPLPPPPLSTRLGLLRTHPTQMPPSSPPPTPMPSLCSVLPLIRRDLRSCAFSCGDTGRAGEGGVTHRLPVCFLSLSLSLSLSHPSPSLLFAVAAVGGWSWWRQEQICAGWGSKRQKKKNKVKQASKQTNKQTNKKLLAEP